MSLSTYCLEHGRHLGQLRSHRRCHCEYASTGNTTSHDNHEKSTHGFPFLSYMSMGLRLAALRAAGDQLLRLIKIQVS